MVTPPPNVDLMLSAADCGHTEDSRGSGQDLPPDFRRKLEAWERIKEKGGGASSGMHIWHSLMG